MMKLGKLVYGLFLAIGICVAAAFFVSDGTFNHGQPHSHHQDMNQGGEGDRHAHGHTLWLGEVWGGLQIILFVALLSFGLRRKMKQCLAFALVGLAYLGIFVCMCLAYRHSIGPGAGDDPSIFLGLPVPAAWMIYGLGGIPLVFAALYSLNFDRWVLAPEAHRAFLDAVEVSRRQTQAESTPSSGAIDWVEPG